MKRDISIRRLMPIFVCLFLLVLNGVAQGGVFCVDTAEGLQTALDTSATNGEDDTIRLVQQNYNGNFTYASAEAYSLAIEGGYLAGCSSRTDPPVNTVLDANGSGTVLNLQNPNAVTLTLDAVTLQNGNDSGLVVSASEATFVLTNSTVQYNSSSGNGGGANIVAKNIDLRKNSFLFNTAAYGGGVNIEHGSAQTINLYDNLISHNTTNSGEGGGIHIKWGSPTVNIVNNVITGNATTVYIGGGHGGGAHISTSGTVNFINNTVAGNTANLACCYGGGITIYYAAYANVYNNVFWGNVSNPGRDIAFYSIAQDNLNLFNNDIDQSAAGVSGLTDFVFDFSNLNAVNPLFSDPTNEDYHLTSTSPCLDAGSNEAPGVPTTDKDGLPRIYPSGVYGIVDMGAYEYQGTIQPTAPDLFGGLREFHYYKLDERIVVKVDVKNRGTKSGSFKVSFYLSDNGVALGQVIGAATVKRGLNTGQIKTVSSTYTSQSSLSGKYFIAVIDSGNEVNEMVETNNRVVIKIP